MEKYINVDLRNHFKFPEVYQINQIQESDNNYKIIISSSNGKALIDILSRNVDFQKLFTQSIINIIKFKINSQTLIDQLSIKYLNNQIIINFGLRYLKYPIYFSIIPNEIKALIQTYLSQKDDINEYCEVIGECSDEHYWKYFYTLLDINSKLILNNKPKNENYIQQYVHLLKVSDIKKEFENDRIDSVIWLILTKWDISKLSKRYMDIENKKRNYVFREAAKEGHIDILQLLLDRGLDINNTDGLGRTALHYAVINGNIKTIDFLLKNGVDVDQKDKDGKTPIFMAIEYRSRLIIRIIEMLLSYNPNLSILLDDGTSILDYAITIGSEGFYPDPELNAENKYKNISIIKLLLEHGAILNNFYNWRKYDIDRALEYYGQPLISLLNQYDIRV